MNIIVPEEYKGLYVCDEKDPIVKFPDPLLREKSESVERITTKTLALIDRLIENCKKFDGAGLSAPQLGVLERVIVIMPEKRPIVLINPEITEACDETTSTEGCLSIPGLYGDVKRYNKIKVRGLDQKGRWVNYTFEGFPAFIVQHEVDHLEGVLFIDRVDPASLFWHMPRYASRKRKGG